MPGTPRESVEVMLTAGATDDASKPILERLIREAGQRCLAPLIFRPADNKYPSAITRLGLRSRLAQELPWMIEPQGPIAWQQSRGDHLQYARSLEKICWANMTAFRTDSVLLGYTEANALESAKRFYDRIVDFTTESVGFSNSTGPARFTIAWWENDDAGMQRALRDSATYSWSDLNLQATYALSRGDTALAGKIIDAMCERYQSGRKREPQVQEFLALIPALDDPKHADHAKALDSFPQFRQWQLAQWILLRRAKLPKDDAIRFLGGAAAPAHNEILIAYLNGNKDEFGKAYDAVAWKGFDKLTMLYALLRIELLGIAPPAEQPDLMPAGAKPLAALIREEAARKSRTK